MKSHFQLANSLDNAPEKTINIRIALMISYACNVGPLIGNGYPVIKQLELL